jgi:hypothetical protein
MRRRRSRTRRRDILFICAGAVLTASATAATLYSHEQTQLELFGILDGGLCYLEHSRPGSDVFASTIDPYNLNAWPHSFTGPYTGGISTSRVGLRARF